ncbi:alpha/beta hydrolase family protein [Compostibacter hankyongensis]|uniref:Alpha/beta hydrolase family protein n=2 Tax=Compostibacter hankyongensis TaxID=1007089 RepID=A0ABP8FWP3_9BACT
MFSRIIIGIGLVVTVFVIPCKGQDAYAVLQGWNRYSDARNALYHDMAEQAYDQLEERERRIAQLHSLSDWQQRQKAVKKTLMDMVGPFPGKTPLNVKITKTVKKEDYTVEDIIYESEPGFYVTSSLFIPRGLKGKAPAVIYCSGHTDKGYRDAVYQHVILNLVKKGFIVFAFDPVGQGERLQYYDKDSGRSVVGGPTHQHSYPGAQAFITGSSLARYMIWDGIRAVDYLLTRREVDPDRIGITGRSGGGTQSAYIAAFDERIHAAAPENYITSFRRLIQAIGPQDAEQNFSHEIANGIDHADLLEVRAPKPTLMITTTRDMFPIQGAMETAKEVRRIFEAYGQKDHFNRVEADTIHASAKSNRVALYAFFQKYLNNPGDSTDLDVTPLGDELRVTETGQVSTSFKDAQTVFSLNKKDAERDVRRLQDKRKDRATHLPALLQAAKEMSGYREPSLYHAPVFTGRYQKGEYVIEKYFVRGEGDYVIPYLLMIPDHANGKAVICLNPEGKSAEVSDGDMEWFIKRGYTVLAPDLLGVGESGRGDYKGDSFIDNTSYGIWHLSLLIGRSIVGIRAADVTRLVQVLAHEHHIAELYGLARGTMCTSMLYAAAFNPAIKRICLIDGLSSYRSLVMNRFYAPRSIYGAVAGALTAYDLPDLAAGLAPRKLMIVDTVNEKDPHKAKGMLQDDASLIQAAYANRSAQKALLIKHQKATERRSDLLSDWIR